MQSRKTRLLCNISFLEYLDQSTVISNIYLNLPKIKPNQTQMFMFCLSCVYFVRMPSVIPRVMKT